MFHLKYHVNLLIFPKQNVLLYLGLIFAASSSFTTRPVYWQAWYTDYETKLFISNLGAGWTSYLKLYTDRLYFFIFRLLGQRPTYEDKKRLD